MNDVFKNFSVIDKKENYGISFTLDAISFQNLFISCFTAQLYLHFKIITYFFTFFPNFNCEQL